MSRCDRSSNLLDTPLLDVFRHVQDVCDLIPFVILMKQLNAVRGHSLGLELEMRRWTASCQDSSRLANTLVACTYHLSEHVRAC